MPSRCSWSDDDLRLAVQLSDSFAQVIKKLGLVPAGGNYVHVKRRIALLALSTSHFLGNGARLGKKIPRKPVFTLDQILVEGSFFQSNKLKWRLIRDGIKEMACEECGWAEHAADGCVPLELDHINGNARDNRIENLRILCPNCHSLKPTHRGKNVANRHHHG